MNKKLIRFNEEYHKDNKWKKLNYIYYKPKILRELYNRLQRRKYYLFKWLKDETIKRQRILDWGCGKSGIVFALKRELNFKEVYGCDVSKTAIIENIQFAKKNKIDVNFKIITKDRLPYPTNYFDAIITIDVFGHVDKPIIWLNELNRILKKDGIIAFHTESKFKPNYFYKKIIKRLGFNPWTDYIGHINLNSKKKLIKMFKKAGFEIEEIISPKASLSFLFGPDITWGINLLKKDKISLDLYILKIWHSFVNREDSLISKFFKIISCLMLYINERIETPIFNERYSASYFKLRKI